MQPPKDMPASRSTFIQYFLRTSDSLPANIEDILFEFFITDDCRDKFPLENFAKTLSDAGLFTTDPRLREVTLLMGNHTDNYVDRASFRKIVAPSIALISRAIRHKLIIPNFVDFVMRLDGIFNECMEVTEGQVAAYIPELARVNPKFWGYSICTIDGQRHSKGDALVPFTIQSCCKPLTYGIALEHLGKETVHSYVGREPSGRIFNALLLDDNDRPHNPMINTGAIVICAILQNLVRYEMPLEEKLAFIMNHIRRAAGGEFVGYNSNVFASEKATGYRNYALAFFLKEKNCFPEKTSVIDCLSLYFKSCCIESHCESMSVVAATLANGGICPITNEKVFRPSSVRDMLSLMHSCGMYDYSGEFAFKIGLPAKSGVSGSMMLIVPNVLGICLWSPPIDKLGNSCKCIRFCELLLREFNFHPYERMGHASIKKTDPRVFIEEQYETSVLYLLSYAAAGDKYALQRHYISGFDMNLSDYDGRTALHVAAAEGHIDCVKFLVSHCQVPCSSKDRWGHLPIDDARLFGHKEVEEYLSQQKNNNTSHKSFSRFFSRRTDLQR